MNRHSPPELIASFKRRVPPRIPKAKKQQEIVPSVSSPYKPLVGTINKPVAAPPLPNSSVRLPTNGRPRGFSASATTHPNPSVPTQQPVPRPFSSQIPTSADGSPYTLHPVSNSSHPYSYSQPQNSKSSWSHPYGRNALPPLSIPSDASSFQNTSAQASYAAYAAIGYNHQNNGNMNGSSSGAGKHNHPPITPTDEANYLPSVYQPPSQQPIRDSSGIFGGPFGYGSDSATTSPIGGANYGTTTTSSSSSSNFMAPQPSPSWNGFDTQGTQLPPLNTSPSNGVASLSALLNPSSNLSGQGQNRSPGFSQGQQQPLQGQQQQQQQQQQQNQGHSTNGPNSTYPSPFSSVPPHGGFSRGMGAMGSPDESTSRPTTSYSSVSVSSMASSGYGDGYPSHHAHRPSSSTGLEGPGLIRRPRGRSDALSGVAPYPSQIQRTGSASSSGSSSIAPTVVGTSGGRPVTAPDSRRTATTATSAATNSGLEVLTSGLSPLVHYHQQHHHHHGYAPPGTGTSDASSAHSPLTLSPSATFAYNVSGPLDTPSQQQQQQHYGAYTGSSSRPSTAAGPMESVLEEPENLGFPCK